MTIVRRDFPTANAAEFSNVGRTECDAVYNATGMIHEPTLQTCLFDDSWPTDSQDHRRLGAFPDSGATCASDIVEDLGWLQEKYAEDLKDLKVELKAAHAQELKILGEQQARTNAMLEKLLKRTGSDEQ